MKKICLSLLNVIASLRRALLVDAPGEASWLDKSPSPRHWLKPYIEFNTKKKRIEAEKKNNKDAKALYKLMNNAIYRKSMENLRNRSDVKLVRIEKYYLKCTSQPSHVAQNI